LNTALRGANALGLARIELDRDALIARAKKETGLGDFGDESFMQPMQLLLQALREEADLNPVGRFMNRANILRILKHRLYVQDLLKRHPEILDRPTPDPVVIVGLARSGTTRLHRLLASDTHFLHLKAWESVFPVPYPECFAARAAGEPDPRIKALNQGLKAVLYMSPRSPRYTPWALLRWKRKSA
ncbi:MAG: sulfotransferase, partial [Proteobacteria bacterium]|nr:sulfotransferase [Pseudomonadota bacterium]